MTGPKIYIDGELFLSLEVIAELYQVRSIWLHEVYELGLLGRGVDSGAVVCIAAVQMDRVATIVSMHEVLGLDPLMIATALD